jgi:hypothetical protein
MKPAKSFTATKALTLLASVLASLGLCGIARAGQVGTVTHLNGPLLAKKADGSVRVLSAKSVVEEGDVLITEKATYARIKFVDNSEMTLRPGTQMKIESFVFEQEKPEHDSATFSLVKGGLRAVTGALGKRNHERFGLSTPTATIGIRGTIFIAEYVPPDTASTAAYGRAALAAASGYGNALTVSDSSWNGAPLEVLPMRLAQATLPPTPGVGGRAPGLYVQVLDGMINLSNSGGSQNFSAGQFGYTPSIVQPPVVLPANPGMQFTPPPAFSASTAPQASSASHKEQSATDCEVR